MSDVIRPRTLRVLAAIMMLTQTGSVTLRNLANVLNTSINAVNASLGRLEQRGLISREHNHGNTIRACVKFIPWEEI